MKKITIIDLEQDCHSQDWQTETQSYTTLKGIKSNDRENSYMFY